MHMETSRDLSNIAIHCYSEWETEQALLHFVNNGYRLPDGYPLERLVSNFEEFPYIALKRRDLNIVTLYKFPDGFGEIFDFDDFFSHPVKIECKDLNMVL